MQNWISIEDQIPPVETPVLIVFRDEVRIGELRWDYPTWEESYKSYMYWDCPYNEGQEWDWDKIKYWARIPPLPL